MSVNGVKSFCFRMTKAKGFALFTKILVLAGERFLTIMSKN
jgi:hypothetical protein